MKRNRKVLQQVLGLNGGDDATLPPGVHTTSINRKFNTRLHVLLNADFPSKNSHLNAELKMRPQYNFSVLVQIITMFIKQNLIMLKC